MTSPQSLQNKIANLNGSQIQTSLSERGYATTGPLLIASECAELAAGYDHAAQFRSRIIMSKHNFGRGEYQYYNYPLPEVIQTLRDNLYPPLAHIATQWSRDLNHPIDYPPDHKQFLAECHSAGQTRPTPLLLKYESGDYNCLHQDLYGDLVFPIQAAFLLSAPGTDFTGGEFVLTEQRPRMQSRVEVARFIKAKPSYSLSITARNAAHAASIV